ncbi:GAP family protein [Cryobacterium sp. AP23]
MWAAWGHVLPIAVATAFSSVPIMATILILLSPNRRRSSVTFLLGFLLGLIVVVVVFTVLAYALPSAPPRRSQVAIGTLLVVIGAALVVIAVVSWRQGNTKPSSDTPRWLAAAGTMGPWPAFALGFLLNLRPKALMLSAAAGLSIWGDDLTAGEAAITVGFYTIVSISSIAYPILASWLRPEETKRWLEPTRAWITANITIVSNLILVMVGVVIIGNGMGRL